MTIRLERIPEVRVEGLGRLGRHVEHDDRSRDYPALVDHAQPLHKVLWRRYGRPFDQGDLGSCTGNAIAGAINTEPIHMAGKHLLVEADAVEIYSHATDLDSVAGSYPPTDTGSSGLAACKAAKALGYITGYRHAFSLADALQALMAGPVITGIDWHEGFDQPDGNGVVKLTGATRGGHEFEVLGYDPASDLLTAENSWGAGWGKGGRFFFTSKVWGELLGRQGDVTVPTP